MATFKGTWLLYMGLLILFQYAITDTTAQGKILKYNCFKDTEEGVCEDSRVKICGDFYACDMVIKLESPPKRIGYRNGEILFLSGGKTYGIGNGSGNVEQVNNGIPPLGQPYDKKGNVYFGSDGTTYVIEGGTGKEIEIITTGEYSYNEHALDTEANKLFVLSFSSDINPLDRTGQIYAVTTDPINMVNNKIQAELVSGVGSSITALSVQAGLDTLLLGIKENDGGKLIRLKRQKYDPCSQKESHKNAIFRLIKEMETKVIELLDTLPETKTKGSLQSDFKERQNTNISRENIRLKRELDLTKEKLKMFSNKIMGFSQTFQNSISKQRKEHGHNKHPLSIFASLPDDDVLSTPDSIDPVECIKRSTLNRLKQENYALKINEDIHKHEFNEFIKQLDDVIIRDSLQT